MPAAYRCVVCTIDVFGDARRTYPLCENCDFDLFTHRRSFAFDREIEREALWFERNAGMTEQAARLTANFRAAAREARRQWGDYAQRLLYGDPHAPRPVGVLNVSTADERTKPPWV